MTQQDDQTRYTGESARLRQRANDLAAQHKINARQQATQVQQSAQQQAHGVLNTAHQEAGKTLGENLDNVFLVSEQLSQFADNDGKVENTFFTGGASNIAVDGGAKRLYWTQHAPSDPDLKLDTGEVALYENYNYQGQAWKFNADITDFRLFPRFNDTISSVRLGPNTRVTLFEHVNFTGRSVELSEDSPWLEVTAVGNDTASSMKVTSQPGQLRQGEVMIFDQPNYGGKSWLVTQAVMALQAIQGLSQIGSVRLGVNTWFAVFTGGNLSGVRQNLTVDTPTIAPIQSFQVLPRGDVQPTDIRPGEVVLYEHANFGGRQLRLSADTPNLINIPAWNDVASSVRVGANTAVSLFEHVNYGGRQQTFSQDINWLGDKWIGNDTTSSVQIHANAQKLRRGEVALYNQPNFGGMVWRFNADIAAFTQIDRLNDNVASVQVGPDTSVTLYEHVNYGGVSQRFDADTPTLDGTTIGRRGSALRVVVSGETLKSGEVALYEHVNFQGRVWRFNLSVSDFQVFPGLNDQISSLKVGPRTTVTVYENVNFGGNSESFSADNPSLFGTRIGNDTMSSCQIASRGGKVNLVSSTYTGADIRPVATAALESTESPFSGSIAINPATQEIYWITSEGVIYQTNFSGAVPRQIYRAPVSPRTRVWTLALHGGRSLLYWASNTDMGYINLKGGAAPVIDAPRRGSKPAPPGNLRAAEIVRGEIATPILLVRPPGDHAVFVAVDSTRDQFYWNDGHALHRANLDATNQRVIYQTSGDYNGLELDTMTQMIYWLADGKLVRGSVNGEQDPETVFSVPTTAGSIINLALVTETEGVNEALGEAQNTRQQAQGTANQNIQDAHDTAKGQRAAAQQDLTDAHSNTQTSIQQAQANAVTRRNDAIQQRDTHRQNANRQVDDAQTNADTRRRTALQNRDQKIADGHRQADGIVQPARDRLDEARRKQNE